MNGRRRPRHPSRASTENARHPAHPQGLRVRPGGPLVPGLRRLLDPRPDPEGDAGLRLRRSENIVFISGIGCSGRLPYYMNTYGFHTIHGRAPTLATGLKAARPDLMVWVITGDGDALSIGGNHLIHSMRRNVDINDDHVQQPDLRPDQGPGVADLRVRQADQVDADGLGRHADHAADDRPGRRSDVRRPLGRHPHRAPPEHARGAPAGTRAPSFVEVLQNCNIFNDGAWRDFTEREVREDRMLVLEHGKPMIFGKDRDKGIRLHGLHPEVVTIGENGVTEDGPARPRRARRGPVPRPDAVADVLARRSRCRSACSATSVARRPTIGPDRRTRSQQAIDRSRARATSQGAARGGETWTVE